MTRAERRDRQRVEDGRAPLTGGMAEAGRATAEGTQVRLDNLAAMVQAGVPILVGTDAPNLAVPAGAAMHFELDRLRQAGMSAEQVLSAVTWENSRFLDPDARFGAVRPGWEADLLLIDGDPVQDWSSIHRIREVWVDGRRVERRARR